jgi:DNA (cytosine-5)-methyltransferase 1
MPQKNSKKVDSNTDDLFAYEKLRTVDLFAGVGGIRMGFEAEGFRTVFSNDFEPKCKLTYDLNFNGSKLIIRDIREIKSKDLPDFDFLLGGFPCQAFSIAGYRQGFEDKQGRGNLFFEIVRILKDKKPLGFMLENVKNLQTHDSSNTFRRIQEELTALGYHFKFAVLNTMTHGNLPQNRERIFIVGFKDSNVCNRFEFPEPIALKVNFRKLLDKKKPDKKYYYNDKELYPRLKPFVTKFDSVYQWRRQYVRENKSGVCPTLTANMGTGGHNVPIIKDKFGIRKLTPKECSRLQGFPEDYELPAISDAALYKQFGNSVSVTVIARIAEKINEALGRKAS